MNAQSKICCSFATELRQYVFLPEKNQSWNVYQYQLHGCLADHTSVKKSTNILWNALLASVYRNYCSLSRLKEAVCISILSNIKMFHSSAYHYSTSKNYIVIVSLTKLPFSTVESVLQTTKRPKLLLLLALKLSDSSELFIADYA